MIEDEGHHPRPTGRQTGLRPNAVGNYRTRLLDAGLMESVGYGAVDFAIPGLCEFLTTRTHS